mmetsp:Transcript_37053/g.74823  ORF Transcript_37053/g.74823 Transcript_37053/m.74823 type:complete len:350 (+) Transcript_37053:394-1443(+)
MSRGAPAGLRPAGRRHRRRDLPQVRDHLDAADPPHAALRRRGLQGPTGHAAGALDRELLLPEAPRPACEPISGADVRGGAPGLGWAAGGPGRAAPARLQDARPGGPCALEGRRRRLRGCEGRGGDAEPQGRLRVQLPPRAGRRGLRLLWRPLALRDCALPPRPRGVGLLLGVARRLGGGRRAAPRRCHVGLLRRIEAGLRGYRSQARRLPPDPCPRRRHRADHGRIVLRLHEGLDRAVRWAADGEWRGSEAGPPSEGGDGVLARRHRGRAACRVRCRERSQDRPPRAEVQVRLRRSIGRRGRTRRKRTPFLVLAQSCLFAMGGRPTRIFREACLVGNRPRRRRCSGEIV